MREENNSLRYRSRSAACAQAGKRILTIVVTALVLLSMSAGVVQAAEVKGGYQLGNVTCFSTYSPSNALQDTYYYSDSWFWKDAKERNDELALASMQLVASGRQECEKENGTGTAFLKELGFAQTGSIDFDGTEDADLGLAWGKKTIRNGTKSCTLLAVSVLNYKSRSANPEVGWIRNFTVNGNGVVQGEHYAFACAADAAIAKLTDLCTEDNIKIWITGHSRGGAVANLIAKRLPDLLGTRNQGVYARTFESPATVDGDVISAEENKTRYGFIHNYVCHDDIVTMVPMGGMTRYGMLYDLKTEKTDDRSRLRYELDKMGSKAANETQSATAEENAKKLVAALERQVPTREAYSAVNKDVFTDSKGNPVEVTFTWQVIFQKVTGIAVRGKVKVADRSSIIKQLDSYRGGLLALRNAVDKDARGEEQPYADYWTAANKLYPLCSEMLPDDPLTKEELYQMFRLAGPIMVALDATDLLSISILKVLSTYESVKREAMSMIYSHHYDLGIARLKILAPLPDLNTVTVKAETSQQKKSSVQKPNGTKILKVKAVKKGFTVNWKKQAVKTNGYQIQYATKKTFKSAKLVTVSGAKKTQKTIKKLKRKKTYYVRIRTYRVVNGKKIYSKWSSAKKIKTK